MNNHYLRQFASAALSAFAFTGIMLAFYIIYNMAWKESGLYGDFFIFGIYFIALLLLFYNIDNFMFSGYSMIPNFEHSFVKRLINTTLSLNANEIRQILEPHFDLTYISENGDLVKLRTKKNIIFLKRRCAIIEKQEIGIAIEVWSSLFSSKSSKKKMAEQVASLLLG